MHEYQKKYLSFYSSFTKSTTTDPMQMLVPIDDHGFHRGDGVFEAMKWKQGKVWLLDKHLERLLVSADLIGIKCPLPVSEIKNIIENLVQLAGKDKGMVRVFLTRGPGNFGVSPRETIGAQIYIVTTDFKEVNPVFINEGVKIGWSQIQVKSGFFARAKTLNYLPNVMMKKECEDRNLDYVISLTSDNLIAESYTENIFFIHNNALIHPKFDYILKGTSLQRTKELLMETINKQGMVTSIIEKDITKEEAMSFDYLFTVGTTIDIQWAQHLETRKYSRPPFYEALRNILIQDQEV